MFADWLANIERALTVKFIYLTIHSTHFNNIDAIINILFYATLRVRAHTGTQSRTLEGNVLFTDALNISLRYMASYIMQKERKHCASISQIKFI